MKKIIILFLLITSGVFSQDLPTLYKKVNSSVVVIETENAVSVGQGDKLKRSSEGGQGSGVLVSEDGLIWTASHVVHTADQLVVRFGKDEIYTASVLSSNPLADVALIKIDSNFVLGKKHVAKIGDSDNVEIGEDIFVLGAPLGIEQTLSKGIVSGRMSPSENPVSEKFMPIEYIQTDAAINPGNSGGPMFNMDGEVIGIASFILSQSGGFNGIGFGASSNIATKFLMEQANFWSGMEFILLRDEMAGVFNLPQKGGLLVLSVSSKGFGNKVGLRGGYIKAVIEGTELLIGGDIILEIAGVTLDNAESALKLRNKLTSFKKGDGYTVRFLRDGEYMTKIVIVE